jgi:hypothetical protein
MKSILFIITMTFSSTFGFGQTDSATSAAMDSIPAKSTLTLAAIYSNDASYYGQRAIEHTPYAAIAANYQLKSGFYLTGQAYQLLNEKMSSVSAASFGAGVNFKLGKKLSTDLSYSHTFYPAYSPLLSSGNADNASITLSYPAWVTINLTGDYAFGKTSDEFVTGGISKDINLFNIGKKDLITISPSANVVAGTQHFYQSYITEKKLRDSVLGIITGPIFGNPGNETHTVATTSFNILSYNFKLPLAYNRSHYVLEAAYQISVLSNKVESGAGKLNSFLTFSFYYQF